MKWLAVVLSAILLALALGNTAAAQDDFRGLVARLPRGANAVMIFNLDKAKQSPIGQAEGWAEKLEKAFHSGVTRVPPGTTRFVLASQLDVQTMRPAWESAVLEFEFDPSMGEISSVWGGELEQVGDKEGIALPNGAYIVHLAPKIIGAIAPANRQSVARWLAETAPGGSTPLSPYLEKAAGYSDDAGTEIIMAIDLGGAISAQLAMSYLKEKPEFKLTSTQQAELAKVLSSVKGFRVGLRTGQKLSGKVVIDFGEFPGALEPIAKPLLLGVLADAGMKIDELDEWKEEVTGRTVSLTGYLTADGLRRVLTLIQSPAPPAVRQLKTAKTEKPDPKSMAEASQEQFKKVDGYLKDLKELRGNAKTLGQYAMWIDKYAEKIERLPILNVDPELVDYAQFVGQSMRSLTSSMRGTQMQAGVQKSQINSAGAAPYGGAGYGYYGGSYYGPYGGYGTYGGYVAPAMDVMRGELRYEAQQRRIIRKQADTSSRLSIEEVKADILAARSTMREKMTQKYQVEF